MENVVRPGTDDVGPWSAKFVLPNLNSIGDATLMRTGPNVARAPRNFDAPVILGQPKNILPPPPP